MRQSALKTILVVEDDKDIATMLELFLHMEGYNVLIAQDGIEALRYLEHHRPALILSDIQMPHADGWELYHAVRADPRYQTLPFILMSAAPPRRVLDQHADFIRKPFQPTALLTQIATMIARAESERED